MKKTLLIIVASSMLLGAASCTRYKRSCVKAHKNKQWINKIQYQ